MQLPLNRQTESISDTTFFSASLKIHLITIILNSNHLPSPLLLRLNFRRRDTQSIPVTEKQDLALIALSTRDRLDPLAPPGRTPNSSQKPERAILDVRAIVLAHDGLDGLGGLVGVVEWDGGDVVVQDVSLDDSVQEVAADEAEFAVDGSGGATGEVPGIAGVVR